MRKFLSVCSIIFIISLFISTGPAFAIQPKDSGELCADNGNGLCVETDGTPNEQLTEHKFTGKLINNLYIKAEPDNVCNGKDVVTDTCPFDNKNGHFLNEQFKGDKIVSLRFTSIGDKHGCIGLLFDPAMSEGNNLQLRPCSSSNKDTFRGTQWVIAGKNQKDILVNVYESTNPGPFSKIKNALDLCNGKEDNQNIPDIDPFHKQDCAYSLNPH